MRAHLAVSLVAIQNNYKMLAAKTAPGECATVIKADAYGLGMAPIAKALWDSGARKFFVALMEEGIALRQTLPDAAIYVLNGILPGEENDFLAHHLVPVLNHPPALELWSGAAKNTKLPAVFHVDTGLNRLGFNVADFRNIPETPQLDIHFIMSHLACADTPENPVNAQQLERFNEARAMMPVIKASLAASDGIFCGPDFHFDLVRPGAALYGLNPTPQHSNPMQPVVQLEAPILQIRDVAQDGFVGYATTAAVKKDQRLATVALGYADGFFRSLSNQAKLYYKGQALPVLGRVSMDVITLDISAVNEVLVPGDRLQVFGPDQNPDQLAKAAGTIGYEVLTALGNRFGRVYTS